MNSLRDRLKTAAHVFADTEMGDTLIEAICELTMMREFLEQAGCRDVQCQDGVTARPVDYDEDGGFVWQHQDCKWCADLKEFLDES